MRERNLRILHAILDSLSTVSLPAASPGGKAGRYYSACMDSARANRDGVRPLQSELSRIDAITSTAALRTEMAVLQQMGVGVAFKLLAAPDPKHSTQVIVHIRQGGLGMPDRDDYLRKDSTMVRTRREYIAHVARTLVLTGLRPTDAQSKATRIMALETQLAMASMTIAEREDPNAIYHVMPIARLAAMSPALAWPAFLREYRRTGHADGGC